MGQVDTDSRYPRRMAKAKWAPPDAEVAAEIDEMVALDRRAEEFASKHREALAKLADPEGRNVPIAHLAEALGVERKTVYRRLGRSMT